MSILMDKIRRLLWRILGFRMEDIARATLPQTEVSLKKRKWVVIGTHSYDNGADAYRSFESESLSIGKYCSIARQVYFLCSPGKHNMDFVSTFPLLELFPQDEGISLNGSVKPVGEIASDLFLSNKPIIVGNDVWIGYRAIIQPGVTIHDGAVIKAGAVVVEDIPPYSIVGGVPARVIRYRFSSDVIEALLQIKWWDWSEEVIKSRIEDFYGPVEQFVSRYQINQNNNQ